MKKAKTILLISAFLLTFIVTKQINVMQDTEEIWKDVVGYEGYYEVSNLGFVRSQVRNGTIKSKVVLKSNGNKNYSLVILQKNGDIKGKLVHRLVAQAFIENPENKKFVNHKNGIKKDNRVDNLEWVTHSENELHAHRTGLKNFKGDKSPARKISSKIANQIRSMHAETLLSQYKLSKIFGISQSTIWQILNYKTWV